MQTLLNRRLISVKGEGVLGFLQGLVTQDTQLLQSQTAIASLFLNAKGRVITDTIIYKNETGVIVDVPQVYWDSIASYLVRHKLRSPITVNKMENMAIAISSNAASFPDPRLSNLLPKRELVESTLGNVVSEPPSYRYERFKLGVVEGQDIPTDSIPIFYNYDLLNAISFSKGCYSGQELVTRTIRRGIVRKRLVALQSTNKEAIGVGATVYMGEKQLGSVFASQDDVGLAVVQLDSASLNERNQFCPTVTALVDSELRIGDSVKCRFLVPGCCKS